MGEVSKRASCSEITGFRSRITFDFFGVVTVVRGTAEDGQRSNVDFRGVDAANEIHIKIETFE